MAFGGLMKDGGNFLAAGALAAAAMPGLVFAFAIPFPVALVISGLLFGGVGVLLRPRRPFEGMSLEGISQGRLELVGRLLSEAEPLMARLEETAGAIADHEMRARILHLRDTARSVLRSLEERPDSVMAVQKLLTYYLPQTVEVAEGYGLLEQRRVPDRARMARAADVVGKLDAAFSHYADSLLDADLSSLDIDLKLLSSSLDADIGKRGLP